MFKPIRHTIIIASTTIAFALLLSTLTVLAAPPEGKGGGKGDGGDDPTGTIYFERNVAFQNGTQKELWTMNADGSNKQMVLPFVDRPAEPSYQKHGGHVWFLSELSTGGTYPDGTTHRQLAAVDDSGFTVTLLSDPEFQPLESARWSLNDQSVSFVGQWWDWTTERVVAGGVYTADVLFDDTGDVTGLDVNSITLVVPGLDIRSHDWSPHGISVAFDTIHDELYIENIVIGGSLLVTQERAMSPAWSPDGTTIAFDLIPASGGCSDIAAISPDGSGLTIIQRSRSSRCYAEPHWSPTGPHLAFDRFGGVSDPKDVYRSTGTGSGRTNLTADTEDWVDVIAWRK